MHPEHKLDLEFIITTKLYKFNRKESKNYLASLTNLKQTRFLKNWAYFG